MAPGISASVTGVAESSEPRTRVRSVPAAPDWRLAGAPGWDLGMLALAVLACGVAVVGMAVLGGGLAGMGSASILVGFAVFNAVALWRSRPRGLFRIRVGDVVVAVFVGCAIRVVEGWAQGSPRFPSYPLLDGSLASTWWLDELVLPVVVAPVVEEFFFRAVIVVCVFGAIRPVLGARWASLLAVLVSCGLFVLMHLEATPSGIIGVVLLGAICGTFVVTTGRIAPAIGTHAVYNLTYVALAWAGTPT